MASVSSSIHPHPTVPVAPSAADGLPPAVSGAELTAETLVEALPALLTHSSVAAQGWLARQCQPSSPDANLIAAGNDAAVVAMQPEGKGSSVAVASNRTSGWELTDPFFGARLAVSECLRNLACTGAKALAVSYHLHFPSDPTHQAALKECVRGLAEAAEFFRIPVATSNLCLVEGGRSHGSLVVSAVGRVEKPEQVAQPYVRGAGETLVLLGEPATEGDTNHFRRIREGTTSGQAPRVDLKEERRLHGVLHTLIKAGVARSAHDLSVGGLLVTVAEKLMAPKQTFGAKLDLGSFGSMRPETLFFGEPQGRVVITVKPERVGTVLSEAHTNGVSATVIGEVNAGPNLVVSNRRISGQWAVAQLRKTMERALV